jgi:hypothetical protein
MQARCNSPCRLVVDSKSCFKLGNLDVEWIYDSPQSKLRLGLASIVAAHDGQLKGRLSGQPEAIIELPSYFLLKGSVLLASQARKVLMQMGIEMMIWMFQCHTKNQPRNARELINGNESKKLTDFIS